MELAKGAYLVRLPDPVNPAVTGAQRQLSLASIAGPDEAWAQSRSKLSVANQIIEALRATGYLSFRNLQVYVGGGLAVLRGRVPSYYLKQKAQTVTFSIPGVEDVLNELEVTSRLSSLR